MGEEETGRTEVWLDPVRSIITHDGKYLCGDCVQGTKPGTKFVEDYVWKDSTNEYAPLFKTEEPWTLTPSHS